MRTNRASNPALVALAYAASVSLGLPDGLKSRQRLTSAPRGIFHARAEITGVQGLP
jgi:hypothetical protein